MISAIQIAGQHLNTPPTKYGVRADLVALGWPAFIQQVIQPEIDWLASAGKPRILLHNPFCAVAGWFSFDQAIHAKNANLITVRDFATAWRPITESGVEVIAYLGTLHADKDFQKRQGPYSGDDYMQRITDSVRPLINAGMSIGFDWSNDYQPNSRESESIELVRAMLGDGCKAYIEPAPTLAFPHLYNWDSITQDNLFRAYRETLAFTAHKTGEVVRWVDEIDWGGTVADVASRLAGRYAAILDDEHTPAGATSHLRLSGYDANGFV